jgi:hypothetical protein
MIFSNNQEKEIGQEIDRFIEEVTHFFNQEIIEAAARSTGFVERESKPVLSLIFSAQPIYPSLHFHHYAASRNAGRLNDKS